MSASLASSRSTRPRVSSTAAVRANSPLQMAVLSDSLMGYGEGIPTYVELLSGQKLRFADPAGGGRRVYYYPGKTTQILLDNIAVVTSLTIKPDVCLIQGGTNDVIANLPTSTVIANLERICRALESAGIRPVLSTTPPNGGSFANSGARAPGRVLNLAIRRLAISTGRLLVDPYVVLVDPATASYLSSYDSGDNTHPSSAGILAWAQKIVTDLTPILPTAPDLLEFVNDGNSLLPGLRFATGNGIFAGSANANIAGSLSNTTAPSGWTPSLVADTSGGWNWQRLTAVAPAGAIQIYQGTSATVNGGDLLVAAVRIRTGQPLTGSNKVVMYLSTYGGATQNFQLLGPLGVTQQINDTVALVYGKVPATANRAQLNLVLPAVAGTYDIALPTIMNLTALGLA